MMPLDQDNYLFIPDNDDLSLRLDVFLAKKIPHLSRSQLKRFIDDGLVTNHGKKTKACQHINQDDLFLILLPKPKASSIAGENIDLNIIYQDEDLIVINKPQGMVVHPGAGIVSGTLCHALRYHFPDIHVGDAYRPGIVHRLDRHTSGVMMVAKNDASHQALSHMFKHRLIKKIYRTFCHGEIKDKVITRITGHIRHPHHRLKFLTLPFAENIKGMRKAHSNFYIQLTKYGISEVLCELHTGRTHQIRAHLADMGHPILGDGLYGGHRSLHQDMPHELKAVISNLCGQALHAESLAFIHPITKKPLYFEANMPKELLLIKHIFNNHI